MENENKIAPMKYTIYRRLKSVEKLYEWSTYVRLKFIIDQVSDSFFFFFMNSNGKRFEKRGVNGKINDGMCVDL